MGEIIKNIKKASEFGIMSAQEGPFTPAGRVYDRKSLLNTLDAAAKLSRGDAIDEISQLVEALISEKRKFSEGSREARIISAVTAQICELDVQTVRLRATKLLDGVDLITKMKALSRKDSQVKVESAPIIPDKRVVGHIMADVLIESQLKPFTKLFACIGTALRFSSQSEEKRSELMVLVNNTIEIFAQFKTHSIQS